jgi:hypothetical protein
VRDVFLSREETSGRHVVGRCFLSFTLQDLAHSVSMSRVEIVASIRP